MNLLMLQILTDKSARSETASSELAVKLAAAFSPWAAAETV